MLKIEFDLLAPGPRTAWLSIPVHPERPALGWARVKATEIPKKQWDQLWQTLQLAEKERQAALAPAIRTSPTQVAELHEAERTAQEAILKACVVDHDASDFVAQVPALATDHKDYAAYLAQLVQAGLSGDQAAQALREGSAPVPCVKENGVLSEATLELYRRVSPDRLFIKHLCASIFRFINGQILDAGHYWRSSGVAEKDIPPPFQRAPSTTE